MENPDDVYNSLDAEPDVKRNLISGLKILQREWAHSDPYVKIRALRKLFEMTLLDDKFDYA